MNSIRFIKKYIIKENWSIIRNLWFETGVLWRVPSRSIGLWFDSTASLEKKGKWDMILSEMMILIPSTQRFRSCSTSFLSLTLAPCSYPWPILVSASGSGLISTSGSGSWRSGGTHTGTACSWWWLLCYFMQPTHYFPPSQHSLKVELYFSHLWF